jgi:hypothetical protein
MVVVLEIPGQDASPAQFESHSVPRDYRFGLDDGQRGSPVGPEPGKPAPEDSVARPQPRTIDGVLVDGNLLPQGQVLGGQRRTAE